MGHPLKPRSVATLAGNLVVLEGADGAGKTALARALHDCLCTSGLRCQRFAFPGAEDGTIGKLVYDLHHSPSAFGIAAITPASLQTLHVAAHVDAIQTRILPALRAGSCVLLDRYWWSTWVYGRVAGVPDGLLEPLIQFERAVWSSIQPAAVVCLQLPKLGKTEIDLEYDRLADRESRSVHVVRIETNKSIEHTLDAVLSAILARPHRAPPRVQRLELNPIGNVEE